MKSIADKIVKNQDGTYRLELRLQMNNGGNLVESKVIIPRATIYVDDNHCIRIKELLSDPEADETIIDFLIKET